MVIHKINRLRYQQESPLSGEMDLKDFDNETKFTEQQITTLSKGVDENLLSSDHDASVEVPFQPPE